LPGSMINNSGPPAKQKMPMIRGRLLAGGGFETRRPIQKEKNGKPFFPLIVASNRPYPARGGTNEGGKT